MGICEASRLFRIPHDQGTPISSSYRTAFCLYPNLFAFHDSRPLDGGKEAESMSDASMMMDALRKHLKELTVTIGERSVALPENLTKTSDYVASFYEEIGMEAKKETYRWQGVTVANVAAEISFCPHPSKRYLLGAHYDSVVGTVGADDNASAVAVQLETARLLKRALDGQEPLDLSVKLVSFALEEPPVFGTRFMGSHVCARRAKDEREKIDGMICLEMVGYTCHKRGCQGYPFPLMFLGYPKAGDFIGLVGDVRSSSLTRTLYRSFRRNPRLPVVKLTVPLRGWLVPAVRLSDHSSFWDHGFKAVMVTDSAFYRNPHYHLPSDTMDKLDYAFMAELVRSLTFFFRSHRGKP